MSTRLAAYLSYRDAPAALGWLGALGFEVVRRVDGENGAVAHCEARLGDVVVMVASYDAEYVRAPLVGSSTGSGLYLAVDDGGTVDDLYRRGIAAGGASVTAPEQTEWGARRARLLDPEGGEWSFGTYSPGQPDDW